MIKITRENGYIAVILILLVTSIFGISRCNMEQASKNELDSFYKSLSDTMKSYRNEKGLYSAEISSLVDDNYKMFLKSSIKDSTIISLQNLVRDYKHKLQDQGSATFFNSNTKIDTVFVSNEHKTKVYNIDKIYTYNVVLGKWIKGNARATKDSLSLKLEVYNEYGVIIGDDSKWYQKSKPTVEIINYNPYSSNSSLRSITFKGRKKIGLGLGVYSGVGLNYFDKEIKPGIQLGVGLSYNILNL